MTRDADLMCVDVSADAFAAGLRRVAPVIPRASTLPVLACVLCEATTDGLLLSGTDLNVAASTVVPARVHTPGAVAVPARRLRTLLRTLARRSAAGEPAGWELGRGTSGAPDDGAASLRLQVRSVGADGLRLEIGYGTLHTRLRGRPSDEFPALPAPRFDECWRVTSAQLRQLVHQTAFAASTDERRPILNGVLWELRPERTRMVATDGHRLARAEVLTPGSASTRRAADLIVQPPALDRMRRLFPADTLFEVAHGDNHLGIRPGEAVPTRASSRDRTRTTSGHPNPPDRIAVADRERLALGIRRMDPRETSP
jgi:DNA polymerase-3 subunit beta